MPVARGSTRPRQPRMSDRTAARSVRLGTYGHPRRHGVRLRPRPTDAAPQRPADIPRAGDVTRTVSWPHHPPHAANETPRAGPSADPHRQLRPAPVRAGRCGIGGHAPRRHRPFMWWKYGQHARFGVLPYRPYDWKAHTGHRQNSQVKAGFPPKATDNACGVAVRHGTSPRSGRLGQSDGYT